MKILMVCLGNICRSPLAQGIFERKLEERGLDWEVDSAGTGMWHIGEPPDPRSVAVAQAYQLDISGQRARQVGPGDLQSFDLILAMDRSNLRDIQRLAEKAGKVSSSVRLMLEPISGNKSEVPDPYWDDDGFEKVYHMLNEAAELWIDQLEEKA